MAVRLDLCPDPFSISLFPLDKGLLMDVHLSFAEQDTVEVLDHRPEVVRLEVSVPLSDVPASPGVVQHSADLEI